MVLLIAGSMSIATAQGVYDNVHRSDASYRESAISLIEWTRLADLTIGGAELVKDELPPASQHGVPAPDLGLHWELPGEVAQAPEMATQLLPAPICGHWAAEWPEVTLVRYLLGLPLPGYEAVSPACSHPIAVEVQGIDAAGVHCVLHGNWVGNQPLGWFTLPNTPYPTGAVPLTLESGVELEISFQWSPQ